MEFHIGKLIKEQVDKKELSVSQFAKKVNMTYRNALYLFDRTDVSAEQLRTISKVLNYDFMKLYSISDEAVLVLEEPVEVYNKVKPDFVKILFSLNIAATISGYENFPELLKRTKQTAEELGFTII